MTRSLAIVGASLVWAVFLALAGGALGACAGALFVVAVALVVLWWQVERRGLARSRQRRAHVAASFGDELAFGSRRGGAAPAVGPHVVVRHVPVGYLPPEPLRVVEVLSSSERSR